MKKKPSYFLLGFVLRERERQRQRQRQRCLLFSSKEFLLSSSVHSSTRIYDPFGRPKGDSEKKQEREEDERGEKMREWENERKTEKKRETAMSSLLFSSKEFLLSSSIHSSTGKESVRSNKHQMAWKCQDYSWSEKHQGRQGNRSSQSIDRGLIPYIQAFFVACFVQEDKLDLSSAWERRESFSNCHDLRNWTHVTICAIDPFVIFFSK